MTKNNKKNQMYTNTTCMWFTSFEATSNKKTLVYNFINMTLIEKYALSKFTLTLQIFFYLLIFNSKSI